MVDADGYYFSIITTCCPNVFLPKNRSQRLKLYNYSTSLRIIKPQYRLADLYPSIFYKIHLTDKKKCNNDFGLRKAGKLF